jgi:hypothetical protein
VFPTINPSELHNPWALKLLGFDVQYAQDGFGAPEELPSVIDRWRAVAKNSVACAQFFQAYRQMFWEIAAGWPLHSKMQLNANTLFGVVMAGCDRVENSSRGALHACPHAVGAATLATTAIAAVAGQQTRATGSIDNTNCSKAFALQLVRAWRAQLIGLSKMPLLLQI